MKLPTFPSPEPQWTRQYAIANSAGLIDVHLNRFLTISQAKSAARHESMAGYNGDCWPVRLIADKQST